jgi:hypothetical protein
MAHVRHPGPNYGPDLQVKHLKPLEAVPVLLGCGLMPMLPGFGTALVRTLRGSGNSGRSVQGYLAHEKQRRPRTLQ